MGVNGCGNGPVSPDFAVTVNPIPGDAGTITGPAAVCAGETGVNYQVPVIEHATNYNWTVPDGATITSGSNTNSIMVSFGTNPDQGVIRVYGSNACGNGFSSPDFIVAINPLPNPTISGPESACENSVNNIYSTQSGMNNYLWAVSDGGTITAGFGTNSISVTWNTAGANSVSVNYANSNNCTAEAPAIYDVTVNPIPETPVVTANGALLTSSSSTGNQWYNNILGLIPGATEQTFTATITGNYWTVVTLNDCPSPESNHVYVLIEGMQESASGNFYVYPTPNDGKFTVSLFSSVQDNYTIIVYNQIGARIYELTDLQVNGTIEKQIDLRPAAAGIYSVVLLNGGHKVVRKVLVNK
jgi:hypothetical protein